MLPFQQQEKRMLQSYPAVPNRYIAIWTDVRQICNYRQFDPSEYCLALYSESPSSSSTRYRPPIRPQIMQIWCLHVTWLFLQLPLLAELGIRLRAPGTCTSRAAQSNTG